jgi:hypothetical protein
LKKIILNNFILFLIFFCNGDGTRLNIKLNLASIFLRKDKKPKALEIQRTGPRTRPKVKFKSFTTRTKKFLLESRTKQY